MLHEPIVERCAAMRDRRMDRARADAPLTSRPAAQEPHGRKSGKSVLADRRRLRHDRPVDPLRDRRDVVILAYPGVQSLDVAGPLEVFAGAQQLIAATGRSDRGYRITIVSRDGGCLRTSSGMCMPPAAN